MRNRSLLISALLAAFLMFSTTALADTVDTTVEASTGYVSSGVGQPKAGPNMWVEFIAPTRSGIRSLYSSKGETFKLSRFAQVLTFGFEYSTGMFSLAVWDSVLESSRLEVKTASTYCESVALFTSPGLALTLRPIQMLAIELDAQYSFSIQVQEYPDRLQHHSFLGGLHVFVEPLNEFVGVSPRLRIGAGIKGGVAMVDGQDYAYPPEADSAAGFMVGVTAGFVFPVTAELAAHIGGGYYAGFNVHDGFAFGDHNIEWNFGLRWFPFTHQG